MSAASGGTRGDRERRDACAVSRRRGERRAAGTKPAGELDAAGAAAASNARPRAARGSGAERLMGDAYGELRGAREGGRGASRVPRAKML